MEIYDALKKLMSVFVINNESERNDHLIEILVENIQIQTH